MKEYVLKTKGLRKVYKGISVISDISIALEAGKTYGLIGQNGAGKTTLMRVLTGLAFPTDGEIEIFGCNTEADVIREKSRIGCMLDTPGLIPYMSAKENLSYHRICKGIPDRIIETELLTLVGLGDTGKKKVKNFSLGMKQRLGIAIALIGNPELLILDEPVNGLDPLGVLEIKKLLIRLCEERHMTILISSNNFSHLYEMATDYIIINHGKIMKTFSNEELNEISRRHILINCDNPDKLASVLEMELVTTNFKVMPDKSIKLYDYLDQKEKVAKAIFDNGIVVTEFSIQGDSLENYFISMIGGEQYV